MLQLDRNRNAKHPVQNFLNKNRRAVRDVKSKSQTFASGSGRPLKPHPPASKPPPQRNRARLPGSADKPSGARENVQEGTVVISKSYLDQLLLMTNGGQGKGVGLAGPQDRGKAPAAVADHVTLHDTVGALHHAPHPRAASPAPQHSEKSRPSAADTVRHARPVSPEGYFPFGRPGCGAPLRTDSGQVMADLRQRQRQHVQNTPANTFPAHAQPVVTSDSGHSLAPSQDVTRGVRGSGGEVRISADMGSPRYARGAGPHVDKYVLREREEQRKKHLEHVDFLKAQIAAKEQAKREERERREREEREEEARLARERERLQSEYQHEMERAKRKEEESRYRQELIQRAIDEATEQALLAKQQAKAHRSPRHHYLQATPTTGPSHSAFSPANSSPPKVTFDLRNTHTLESGSELLASDKFQALRSPSMLQLQDHTPSSTSTQRHKDMRQSQEVSSGVNVARETGRAGGGARGSRIPVRNSRVKERTVTQRTGQRQLSPQHMLRAVRNAPQGEGQRSRNAQNSQIARAEYVRVTSPPVPALARKLGQQGGVAPGPASLRPPPVSVEEPVKYMEVGMAISDSPPVPALAKKLKHGVTEPTSAAALPTRTGHSAANLPQKANSLPIINPPAPAAKERQVGVASTTSHTHLPPIVTERPHSPTSRVILQELAALRKGLLSHRSTIDQKLSTLFHNH